MSLTKKQNQKISTALCFFLRHKPEEIGITINTEGFTCIDSMIDAINNSPEQSAFLHKLGLESFTHEQLRHIVDTDKKERYKTINDFNMIRCNQGHSLPYVDIAFDTFVPVNDMYHGTSSKYIDSIMKEGLKPQTRLYTHLSKDLETAKVVGKRHCSGGKFDLVILKIAKDTPLHFMITDNGVLQVESVPPEYLEIISL